MRNKEYFANNYLDKKIEQVKKELPPPDPLPLKAEKVTLPASPLVLPAEIIAREFGVTALIVIHYLARKIVTQRHRTNSGFP